LKKLFLITMLIAANCFLLGQETKLMTYNLRYENDIDGENNWVNRRDFLLSQINYYEPDIFGTQEGVTDQIKWMDNNLDKFGYVGIGREIDEGKGTGEYSAIFYNKEKFLVIESNTFWLSQTPDKASKGWDAAQFRICTYALFESKKEGKRFYVFNTHFDHRGDIAREKSAELILAKINSINATQLPVVLMGDFNLTPESSPIAKISKEMNDSRATTISKPFGPEETFCDFDICKPPQKRIDYIFTCKNKIIVNKYATLVDVMNKHYPSDHYPVLINISFVK
jgi:endonuclease/exonuclease/phosphatase family metal-dependent hydrolase